MKARIQLIKSDQPDAKLFSLSSVLYVNNVFDDIDRSEVTYCEMLLVTKSSDIKYGDYCLINDNGVFIVERCDKVVKSETIGVRDVFIGQSGTLTAMDNVEKILATTRLNKLMDLPNIHNVFVEIFVKLANDGNKITEVNVVTDEFNNPKVGLNNAVTIQKYIEEEVDEDEPAENSILLDDTWPLPYKETTVIDDDWVEEFIKEWTEYIHAGKTNEKKQKPSAWVEVFNKEGNLDQVLVDSNIKLKTLDMNVNKTESSIIFKLTIPNEFNEQLLEKLAILQELGIMA